MKRKTQEVAKHDRQGTEKRTKVRGGGKPQFWKKWWFWVIVVVAVVAVAFTDTPEDKPESEPVANTATEQPKETGKADESEKPTQEPQKTNDTDRVITTVKEAIKRAVGENEFIKDVVLENKDLKVYVDFTKTDPSPISKEDLAIARTGLITDEILSLEEYDPLWNTITVDFGKIGSIKNSKENIESNEYGRYFKSENFKLEN